MRRVAAMLAFPGLALLAATAVPPSADSGTPSPPATSPASPPGMSADRPVDAPGLHNVVAYADGLWCGGVPEGDAGFASLRAWGIRTVISVDGAVPDAARAARFGLRYVHLPIGYDGFDDARRLQLARAVRDLPGPVYLHCHHGKHRAAGAGAAVAVTLGKLTTAQATARMRVSGTAPTYPGLYACAANASPAAADDIAAVPAEFPEATRPSGLVESMIAVDAGVDRLVAIERAGWKAPADHPDLVPAAEAAAVAEQLRLLAEAPDSARHPDGFRALLARDHAAAQRLEDLLAGEPAASPERLAAELRSLQAGCKECHAAYRDRRRSAPDNPKSPAPR